MGIDITSSLIIRMERQMVPKRFNGVEKVFTLWQMNLDGQQEPVRHWVKSAVGCGGL